MSEVVSTIRRNEDSTALSRGQHTAHSSLPSPGSPAATSPGAWPPWALDDSCFSRLGGGRPPAQDSQDQKEKTSKNHRTIAPIKRKSVQAHQTKTQWPVRIRLASPPRISTPLRGGLEPLLATHVRANHSHLTHATSHPSPCLSSPRRPSPWPPSWPPSWPCPRAASRRCRRRRRASPAASRAP